MAASNIERLSADGGRRLVAALAEFRTLAGLEGAATQLAEAGELLQVAAGGSFITQDDAETDVLLIVAGAVNVAVNGKVVNTRRVGEHVGEMAAIEPTQLRAATITAIEPAVVLKVTESDFSRVADARPMNWRRLWAGTVKQVAGIDSSTIRAARRGVRGGNHIVWKGREANHAAKLTELDQEPSEGK